MAVKGETLQSSPPWKAGEDEESTCLETNRHGEGSRASCVLSITCWKLRPSVKVEGSDIRAQSASWLLTRSTCLGTANTHKEG